MLKLMVNLVAKSSIGFVSIIKVACDVRQVSGVESGMNEIKI